MNTPPVPPRHAFRPLLLKSRKATDDAPLPFRRAAESCVRIKAADAADGDDFFEEDPLRPTSEPRLAGRIDWLDAQVVLDEIEEDSLTLSVSLDSVSAALDGLRTPLRPAPTLDVLDRGSEVTRTGVFLNRTSALIDAIDGRVKGLGVLGGAIDRVADLATDPRLYRLFVPNAPLADYLRGLHAWSHAVIRALEQLVVGIGERAPDWGLYRWRIEEAKNFHFDELDGDIDEDLTALALLAVEEGGDGRVPIGPLSVAIDDLLQVARELESRLDERFA